MAKKETHPDVEFTVLETGGRTKHFKVLDEAAASVFRGALENGTWQNLVVHITSEDGARWWGGQDAVDLYLSNSYDKVSHILRVKVTPEPTFS